MEARSHFPETMDQSCAVQVVVSAGTELIAQFATRIMGELTLRTKVRLHVEFA
jgi:hypothetical protein